MEKKKHFCKTLFIFTLATATLHAAVLDDLFENITHKTIHKKHHRSHRSRTISDEEKWQTALKFLGYYHGKIDGDLFTPESFDAIKRFQEKREVIATGFLEDEYKSYLSYIYDVIAMKKTLDYQGKNRKKNRKKIQAALSLEGVYTGRIDGVMGKKSKASILSYKRKMDMNTSEGPSLSDEEKRTLIEDARISAENQLMVFKQADSSLPETPKEGEKMDDTENIQDLIPSSGLQGENNSSE